MATCDCVVATLNFFTSEGVDYYLNKIRKLWCLFLITFLETEMKATKAMMMEAQIKARHITKTIKNVETIQRIHSQTWNDTKVMHVCKKLLYSTVASVNIEEEEATFDEDIPL